MSLFKLALESHTRKVKGYNRIDTTPENIKEYTQYFSGLRHVKTGKKFEGALLIEEEKGKKKFVAVLQCNVETGYIVALEVGDDYRKQGIASALINLANREFHCHYLSVRKNNRVAQALYKKHNYKVIREDASMLYMKKDYKDKE